jgi:hypothetical protein
LLRHIYLLLRLLDQQFRLRGIHRKCFLTQHVLPSFQTQHGILVVVRVRGSDVDNIDIRIRNEFLIGAVRFCGRGRTNIFEELFGARSAGGARGGHDGVCDGGDATGLGVDEEVSSECLGNSTGSKNAPADGWGSGRHGGWG